MKHYVVIEGWDGDGGIQIPDETLQKMGVDAGGIRSTYPRST